MGLQSPNLWIGSTTAWATGSNWSAGVGPFSIIGTAQAGAAGTITLAAGDTAATGAYIDCWITLTAGTGAGQVRRIVANDGGTKVATVDSNWVTAPDNTTVYRIGVDALLSNSSQAIAASDQSAVVLHSLTIDQSMTGAIAANGTYLKLAATTVTLGAASPSGVTAGSGRLNLQLVGVANVTVLGTASRGADAGMAPVRLLSDALTLTVLNGTVAIAPAFGESATVSALTSSNGGGPQVPGIYLGAGANLQSGSIYFGTLTSASMYPVTALTVAGKQAAYVYGGTGGHGALTIGPGATVAYNGSGPIATLEVQGTLDLSAGAAPVVVTNAIKLRRGFVVQDPLGRLVALAGFTLVDCTLLDGSLNVGRNRSLAVS